jgi:hypothetical protein
MFTLTMIGLVLLLIPAVILALSVYAEPGGYARAETA